MKNDEFGYFGIFAPILFWLTLIICGFIVDDYNHLKNLVSELGAIEYKSRYVFTIGLFLSSIASFIFISSINRTFKRNGLKTFPIICIYAFPISMIGAGIFPLHLIWHSIFGLLSMLLILSPLLAIFYWKNNSIKAIKLISTICLLLMIGSLLLISFKLFSNFPGLNQRVFHLGWTIWFIYLSLISRGLRSKRITSH